MSTSEFTFRARDAAGALQVGRLQAASAVAVADDLAGRGWVPLAVERAVGGAPAVRPRHATASLPDATADVGAALRRMADDVLRRRPGASKRSHQALALVMREIAALLKAGVPILRALQLTADASHDERIQAMLRRLGADLDAGHDLSSAASRELAASDLLTAYDVSMLEVGERTGRLVESFQALYRHREFIRGTRDQVAQALRYPMFVIGTCVLALIVVNVFVIPQFAAVFASLRTELPLLTRVLLGLSHATVQHGPWLAAAAAAAVWVARRWTRTPAGELLCDRLIVRVPIVGPILRGILLARFTASFSAAFGAGLTVPQALAATARTLGNAHMAARVQGMVRDLERGSSIAQSARAAQVFPPTLLQLIAIGEETGALEELTAEMARHFESEVSYSVQRLSSALEPLLIWLLGMGVLVLALGIFMPMWELGRASIG